METNDILNIYFGLIEDKRDQFTIKHKLIDILKLIMISVLCGMDELDKIVDYGNNKKEFLEKEFNIKTIPSKPTMTRVLVMIDTRWLGLSIVGIVQSLIKEKNKQIMFDGRAIRSTDAIKSIEKMINIVTAYTDTGVSLLQKTVEEKTNEIPAVQELIDMLDVEGLIITADAMHCQKETAKKIIENGGDYVLQLKANQKSFYEDVYAMFDDKYMSKTDKECEYEIYKTQEKKHGRIETRTCYVLNEVAFFTDYVDTWKGLKKIFAVKRKVEKDEKISEEMSCYLSSKNASAKELLEYTRNHWQIESMHHILDITFDEDRCKLLSKRAQENMNIFRKMGASIHKNYLKGKKQTVKSNMFNFLLNDSHLLEILQNCNIL